MAQTESSIAKIATDAPVLADVAIPTRVAGTFTYRIPAEMANTIAVGARVLVPFGRVQTIGYVVGLSKAPAEPTEFAVKDLLELLDPDPVLVPEVMTLARWVAEYYAAPWGEVLKAALPSGMNATITRVVSITPAGREELQGLAAARLSKIHGSILELTADADSDRVTSNAQQFRVTPLG
ncbi:MAG: hypothetical protein ABIP75_11650, partial [Pyrinomonadaceae bacterium]